MIEKKKLLTSKSYNKLNHNYNMAGTLLPQTLSYLRFFFIYLAWWVLPLGFLFFGKVKWSRHPIEAIILEKRGDNFIKTNDRIGIHRDKNTGHVTYRLLKNGDTIDVLPFDSILHNTIQDTNILEKLINKLRKNVGTVHLLKYGSKQYKPIKVTSTNKGVLGEDNEGNIISIKKVKDSKGNDTYCEHIEPFDIRKHLGFIDFQIIDWDDVNTTINEIENSRIRRIAKWESWGKFLLPLAIIGVTGVIAIVVIYLTYDAQLQFCEAAQVAQPAQPFQPNESLNIPGIRELT